MWRLDRVEVQAGHIGLSGNAVNTTDLILPIGNQTQSPTLVSSTEVVIYLILFYINN